MLAYDQVLKDLLPCCGVCLRHFHFRSLCHDYDRCEEALGRFREQAETVPERVAEYERLLAELEDDIRRTLDNE